MSWANGSARRSCWASPQHLRQVALSQAQAKDYVRQIQVRLLVHPLLERLRAELGGDAPVEAHLLHLLVQFRSEDAATQGYGPANVITLLTELRGHLRGLDLSRLSIRGASLQGVEMQDALAFRSDAARGSLHRAPRRHRDGHYKQEWAVLGCGQLERGGASMGVGAGGAAGSRPAPAPGLAGS